jgi:uncharacterized membrane protein
MTRPRSLLSETESLAALVHGIFAITMTLLILDLRVPAGEPGELLGRLGDLAPQFGAYVFGFVYLGANWLTIREWFHLLRGVDRAQTLLILLFVALISLTPFTVALVADSVHDSDDLGTAVRVMAGVVGAAYGVSAALTMHVTRRGNIAKNQRGTSLSRPFLLAVACGPSVLAIGLSFITPWLGIGVLSAELVSTLFQGWETQDAEDDAAKAASVTATG